MPRVVISVSNKHGIDQFARCLHGLGWEIVSTGGTAKFLREHDVPVVDVNEVTHFPECLEGRVKTLHPGILAGVLAKATPEHRCMLADLGIEMVDMVVVNLYPFEIAIASLACTWEVAIENIDVGGPTMLRAAAKNHERMVVVTDPNDYSWMTKQMMAGRPITLTQRVDLAIKVFELTSAYDSAICHYMRNMPKPMLPP